MLSAIIFKTIGNMIAIEVMVNERVPGQQRSTRTPYVGLDYTSRAAEK